MWCVWCGVVWCGAVWCIVGAVAGTVTGAIAGAVIDAVADTVVGGTGAAAQGITFQTYRDTSRKNRRPILSDTAVASAPREK